jgi:methylglutaconyl-CoA hydratase
MDDDFAELLEMSARFFASDEGQEGIRAFGEKRPPRWVPADPA